MTNEATRLAACPFCEGACTVTKGYSTSELPWSGDGGDFFRVYCSKCQARQLFHRTQAEAVEAWNSRAARAQPAVIEEARDAARYRWLRSGLVERQGRALSDRIHREINRSRYSAMLTFRAWCEPVELDAAIDAAMASQEKPHD